MAILVAFARTDETPGTVSYACGYGGNPAEHRFIVDTRTVELRRTEPDEEVPHAVRCAWTTVVRVFRATGTWPASGSYCA
ncbi:hypothetical protein [Nocardiopsis ansamitocini]|uniref:Uncharacterized protein n=1 Tax=Nocardiopsis ansamitocini TaxID=1670832 RepID=A0A9W6P3Q0_9ACTN|nr:hypothetical protein [Nocardiopsis ansamitocini]GLU46539.1 hypothetical protein Nans01_08900 [Nocardiopsis ansamitocini]